MKDTNLIIGAPSEEPLATTDSRDKSPKITSQNMFSNESEGLKRRRRLRIAQRTASASVAALSGRAQSFLIFLTVIILLSSHTSVKAVEPSKMPVLQELLTKTQSQGTVPIIVGFQIPLNEGSQKRSNKISSQETDILKRQNQILNQIPLTQ